MLLEEFDANRQAIINPQDLHQPIEGFPKVVISCFSRVTFARLLENYDHEVIARTHKISCQSTTKKGII